MSGVIDGRKWLQDRLRFLEAELDREVSEDQRRALEAEIEKVRANLGASGRRFRRWFVWGGRPPTS